MQPMRCASASTGICHEGFPVLLPRRFYGDIKARITRDGFAPVTLQGEMRYLPDQLKTLFGSNRELPLLYLHIDKSPLPTAPRREVNNNEVSIAVSFRGKFEGENCTYATFATFDPADQQDKERASGLLLPTEAGDSKLAFQTSADRIATTLLAQN